MPTRSIERRDVAFLSSGDECRAWLFLPDVENPPVVVMGHGLGGTREDGLEPFARRFAEAGIAALVFTYRHFGDSGGEPRQLLDIGRQLDDWAAALAFARSVPEVDAARVALWGTSFGGGHVLVAAARDGEVAAVVSQCPFTDGVAATRAANPRALIGATVPVARDLVAKARGRRPVTVPLVGPPGSVALMTSPDSEPGFRALVGEHSVNAVAARFLLQVSTHRPGRVVKDITAPVLFCLCDSDAVAPADVAARYAATAPRVEIKRYPVGHFDIYVGEPFERAVADQAEFLVRHLGAA